MTLEREEELRNAMENSLNDSDIRTWEYFDGLNGLDEFENDDLGEDFKYMSDNYEAVVTVVNKVKSNLPNNNEVIYSLNIEDLQTVAEDVLSRELSPDEIEKIREKVGDNIDWYGAIWDTISQNIWEE